MMHLLAYLFVRRPDGSWSVSSHRNLDGVAAEWKAVHAIDEKASAIVHVGFWRPDASSFSAACLGNEGKVLLTSAAKFALPSSYRSASHPLSTIEGFPIYLASSGWGYEIEENPSSRTEPTPKVPPAQTLPAGIPHFPSGWIERLEAVDAILFRECSKLFILNESLYQEREALLPSKMRDCLANYRFNQLAGHNPSRDLLVDELRFAPPWILRLSTKSLNLQVRAGKRLADIGADAVSDIAHLGTAGLLRIGGLGRKSLVDISTAIFRAFERGSAYCALNESKHGQLFVFEEVADARPGKQEEPTASGKPFPEVKNVDASLEPKSFREALQVAFSLLTEREASVLRQRMGIAGNRMTLEKIAGNYSVTRERVRQIEVKAINRILDRMSAWADDFRSGLRLMLDGRGTPLPLLGLEVLNPWFTGADTLAAPFEYSLEHFIEPPEFHIIRTGGQAYVSRIRQDEWQDAERSARALLSTWSKRDTPALESDIRVLIESQLGEKSAELRPLLWEVSTRWAHFSSGPPGERTLISFGIGAESIVESVLSESDVPLHYSNIAKRCAAKGRPVEVRRVHHVAASVGYLLGRGIYGLEKHIALSEEERERVLGEVEGMLFEAPGRQWHAGEICDELEARGLDFEGRLSKYDLNVILGSSISLAYLGRMIWATRVRDTLGSGDRLNIWQAIVALVQDHGSPMHASDIREIISRDRGLGSTFQIHQADPLIRVGENEWGILWRDIPFNEKDAKRIVEEMISILEKKAAGLHISEIIPSLERTRDLAAKANPALLVALATRTEAIKAGKGGYAYLPNWEGSRRLTVGEAVERAFDLFDRGVSAVDVAKRASHLLGRAVTKNTASSMLMKIGVYDQTEGLWFHPEESSDTLEEGIDVIDKSSV